MSDLCLDWLPDLILLKNFKGRWEDYLQELYRSYCEDFVQHTPSFQGGLVRVRTHPEYDGKGVTFWHLISEGDKEDDRTPDMRRCERIRWPRCIIETDQLDGVRIWETYRVKGFQKDTRLILAVHDFSYVVVLAKLDRGYKLITAYHVERENRRVKLKKDYDEFLRQKKGGCAS